MQNNGIPAPPQPDLADDGFVFVTSHLPSVSDFTSWLEHERLPDAQTLLSSRRLKEDEVLLSIDRESFVHDLVRSFLPSHEKRRRASNSRLAQAAGSPRSATPTEPLCTVCSLDDEGIWTKAFQQFVRDFPRQLFFINGTQCGESPEAALDEVRHALRSVNPSLQDAVKLGGLRDPASKGGWLQTLFTPISFISSSLSTPEPVPVIDGVERITRFVALASQQSVLALPFEIIATQYMRGRHQGDQLFVADVTDDKSRQYAMRVDLMLPTAGPLVLQVTKRLRVFALVEETDVTLFGIEAMLRVNLLGGRDEPLDMRWRISDHPRPSTETRAAPRTCECLGASSGYHKTGCPAGPP